jgi:hypothetical protein
MIHYRYRIEVDGDAESPRKAFDNVGTMVCWHHRYQLGDEQPSCTPEEYVEGLFDKCVDPKFPANLRRLRSPGILSSHYARLPLYLYDHSGITMNTTGFSCPWDSGQVGFIYCSLETAQKEFGTVGDKRGFKAMVEYDGKTMTLEERAELCLKQEVETYDQFISGEVYWWCVESCETEDGQPPSDIDDADWETVESCGGCYGRDYAEQEAKETLEACKKRGPVLT